MNTHKNRSSLILLITIRASLTHRKSQKMVRTTCAMELSWVLAIRRIRGVSSETIRRESLGQTFQIAAQVVTRTRSKWHQSQPPSTQTLLLPHPISFIHRNSTHLLKRSEYLPATNFQLKMRVRGRLRFRTIGSSMGRGIVGLRHRLSTRLRISKRLGQSLLLRSRVSRILHKLCH